jgi:hypothetical protein
MSIDAWFQKYLGPHWQVIIGALLYYTGRDILSASHNIYWVMQSGQWMMDIAAAVFSFKAINETVNNKDSFINTLDHTNEK